MKIIVLGGAGRQGSRGAALLAAREDISEVVLADASAQALGEAAARVGAKARPVMLDATGGAAVRGPLTEAPKARVVLNTVGPGFRFAVPMMRAAVESGIDYVDIQDDAEIIPEVEAMDQVAKAADRTMISGIWLASSGRRG